MSFEIDIAPRFDYGRSMHTAEVTAHGAVFTTDALTLTLHAVRDPDDERPARPLRMHAVGFISPYDPMWASTLAAMDGELVSDSLVYRYDPRASPDGLRGSEGTFSLCDPAITLDDALDRDGPRR